MLEIIMRILSAAVTIFLVFFLVSYLYALVEDVKKKLRGITKIDYTPYNVAYFLVFWFFFIFSFSKKSTSSTNKFLVFWFF